MQPSKIPDAVRGEIIARAWGGETFTRIARDLGLSGRAVSRVALREGGFPTKAELIELQRDAICAAYEESGSMLEVAKRLALSHQTVSNTLHARGIRKQKPRRR
jgi:transcriptional regulator of aromatic amino acid metabolism